MATSEAEHFLAWAIPVDPETLAISMQAYVHSKCSITIFEASVHHSHDVMRTLPREITNMISTWVRRYHYVELAQAGWTQSFRCCRQKCKPKEHFDRARLKELKRTYLRAPADYMQPSKGFEQGDPFDNWLTSNTKWSEMHKAHVQRVAETLREEDVQFLRVIEIIAEDFGIEPYFKVFPNYEGTRADFHAFLIDVIRPIDGNKNIYPAYNFVFIESLEPKDMTLSETQRSNFIRATMCLELQIMPIHRNRSSCRNALKAEDLAHWPKITVFGSGEIKSAALDSESEEE